MEGRRKELLLLVLAVVALGVALYTFRAKPAATPPAPAAGTPEATETGKEEAASSAGQEAQAAAAAGQTEGTAQGQRNPFATPGATETAAAPAATTKGAAAAAAGMTDTTRPAGDTEPAPGPQPAAQPSGSEAEKPSLTLTGVVNGRPNVAIIRQDDRRYFVKVGDTVGDYRVKTIANQQVVLVGAQGKVTLRMGGRQ